MEGHTEFKSIEAAARFVAELVRQGIRYRAREDADGEITVTTTGGF